MTFKERIAAELEKPDAEPETLVEATPEELAEAIALFLDNKRGREIKVIPMKGKTDICDFMVLATGTSNTHVRALADEVEFKVKEELGIDPIRTEGQGNNMWILIDYGSVIVHVFTKEGREFYKLDKLWNA